MFRRKRSSSHHHPLTTASSQSAQSAASHAYLKSQSSSSSLSSAAAAAALRSHTPTPQAVEYVQTKRIQRRASTTSQPNLGAPRSQNLRRASSSNSMSNRTFREPSPRRPATSSGFAQDVPPPLPSLPAEYASQKTVPPSARRSVSMQPPMRPMSPPRRTGIRGVSVDRKEMGSPVRPRSSLGNGLSTVPELERSASRNSINFSYPLKARPNSPSPPPSPPTRREVPVSLAQQLSSNAPPVKPARPRSALDNRRASAGNARPAPAPAPARVTTAVAAAQAAIVPSKPNTRDQVPVPSRPAFVKRPSTVPEDYQGEERAVTGTQVAGQTRTHRPPPPVEQDRNPTIRRAITPDPQITKSPPTPERPLDRQLASPDSNRSVTRTHRSPQPVEQDRNPTIRRAITPDPQITKSPPTPERSLDRQLASPDSNRSVTRFSTQLSVGELQLHHPPPRSVSPVKSAMKHSSQGSLSPDQASVPVFRAAPASSELSDGTSVGSDDGLRIGGTKRRPVKVSFDDEAEVMGVAASPPTSPEDILPDSPPGRSKPQTAWVGAGRKKPAASNGGDEFDEVLKPRPALPSFGSIRATRDSELLGLPAREEPSDNESTTSSATTDMVPGWSFSNDHAVAGILQADKGERLSEKIEHPPLPAPVRTPKHVDEANENGPEAGPVWLNDMQAGESTPKATAPDLDSAPVDVAQLASDLEKGRSSLEGYIVPGGFPRTSLEFDPKTAAAMSENKKSKPHGRSSSGSTIVCDESGTPIGTTKVTDDESDGSVYSDAAEEVDRNGFGSINAIVGQQTNQENTKPSANAGLQSNPDESQEIGRAVSPPLDAAFPWPPDSQDAADGAFPFSSPYPPFPTKQMTQSKAKSNGTAAKESKRAMYVAGVRGVSFSQDVTNGAPRDNTARPKTGTERKRPVSLGPILANGKSYGAQRPTTSGSDSSSSFRLSENRSPNGRDANRHTMRQTMRASSQEPKVQFSPSRPMSADGHRPTSSGSNLGMMRTTLRGSGGPNKGGKTSFFSTGKSPSKSPGKKKVSRPPGTLFSSSRFGDSDDDEGDARVQAFRSRFADSSDEDEPGSNALRPVRGIPRRHDMQDGESTELEDSSDEEKRRPTAAVPATTTEKPTAASVPSSPSGLEAVARSRGVTREELEEFLHQPNRKSGILSRLNLRKPKPKPNPKTPETKTPETKNPETKLRKSAPENPVGGHDRVGSTTTTVTANNSEIFQATEPASAATKGQRRGSKMFNMGEGWPLRGDRKGDAGGDDVATVAPPAVEEEATRVGTFGGGEGSHFPKQRATARDVVIAGSGRKKRFPKLRKALGLG